MSKKYYLSYLDNNITLLQRINDTEAVIITQNINEIIRYIEMNFSIDNCIIKYNLEKNIVVLQNLHNKSFISIRNSSQILDRLEFKAISQSILAAANHNGCIDVSQRDRINRKTKRHNRYNKSLISKITALILSSSIAITAFTFSVSSNNKSDGNENVSLLVETVSSANNSDENSLFNDYAEVFIVENQTVQEPDILLETVEDYPTLILEEPPVEETLIEEIPVNPIPQVSDIEETQSYEYQEEYNYVDSIFLDYEDLSYEDKVINAKNNYYSIIEKYSKKYGLDPDLVLCIAVQEKGFHSSSVDRGGGIGLMQIQYSVWAGSKMTYYELNEDTGLYEKKSTTITDEMLKNVDTNIQVGCMILQECLRNTDYNIPLAIQMYNMGIGSISSILGKYASGCGITKSEVRSNQTDTGWLSYRKGYAGDPYYLENVIKWAEDRQFTVTNVFTGEPVSIEFTNEKELSKSR